MGAYYLRVVKRAAADTATFAKSQGILVGLALVILAAAVSAAYRWHNDESVPSVQTVLYALAASALLMVLVFAVCLIRAPYLLDRDSRDEVQAAEKRTAEHASTTDLAAALEAARELHDRKVTTEDQLEAWIADLNAWGHDVQAKLPAHQRPIFLDTTGMMAADVLGSFNAKHSDNRLRLSRLMANLRTIMGYSTA